jgi:hypothetical protein
MVTLLVSVLLLHLGLPHHGPSVTVAVERTLERSETHVRGSTPVDAHHLYAPESHHGGDTDPIGLRARGQQFAVPVADGGLGPGVAAASYAVPAGAEHERTARDRRSPSMGETPTPAALQTFRC